MASTSIRLRALAPEAVSLDDLESVEPSSPIPPVRCALRLAHSLAAGGVAYRHIGRLGKDDLQAWPFALSCSEMVYYVYARCGVDLGDVHQRTRLLAHAEAPPYVGGMKKVETSTIVPGDVLVYHYDRDIVEEEVARRGRARAGHVVIAVSATMGLVVGSHGKESTPESAPTGVGYRVMEDGFGEWTLGRKLRAVYRISTWSSTVGIAATSSVTDTGDEPL